MHDDGHAVHEHVVHSNRELVRIRERRLVGDLVGIEDNNVCPHALLEHTAIAQTHALRRQRGELADRILQGEQMLLADELAKDSRKRPVRPRMRMFETERSGG